MYRVYDDARICITAIMIWTVVWLYTNHHPFNSPCTTGYVARSRCPSCRLLSYLSTMLCNTTGQIMISSEWSIYFFLNNADVDWTAKGSFSAMVIIIGCTFSFLLRSSATLKSETSGGNYRCRSKIVFSSWKIQK